MNTVQLVITFTPETGEVQLSGPLENRFVCYGMLEMAREILAKRGPANDGNGGARKIVVPTFVPPKLVP